MAPSILHNRFWSKVNKNGPVPELRPELGPCWIWNSAKQSDGYGSFWFAGRAALAHRIAYEWENGPIPLGLEPDHLCRTRACVRPSHMEVVTKLVNMMRGNGKGVENAAKTHCPKGHAYTPENTIVITKPGGVFERRECKVCRRATGRKAQQRYRQNNLDAVRERDRKWQRERRKGT